MSLVLVTATTGSGFSPATCFAVARRRHRAHPHVGADVRQGALPDRGPCGRPQLEHVDLLPTVADIAASPYPGVDGFSRCRPVQAPRRSDKWWYDSPVDRRVVPGAPNFRDVLHGVTDTLVRAHQNGARGFYQFGATADWVYRSPGEVGQVGGGPVAAKMKDWARFRDHRAWLGGGAVTGRRRGDFGDTRPRAAPWWSPSTAGSPGRPNSIPERPEGHRLRSRRWCPTSCSRLGPASRRSGSTWRPVPAVVALQPVRLWVTSRGTSASYGARTVPLFGLVGLTASKMTALWPGIPCRAE